VRTPKALISAALKLEDLQLDRYEPGTKAGPGVFGFLDREGMIVNVASGQSAEDEAVVIAHELGHYYLHRDPRHEVTVKIAVLGGDPVESGAGRVSGYSSRERKEVQADVFAGEFLCPADWLRQEILDRGKTPSEIARELTLPPNLVLNQAIRALLLPALRPRLSKPQQAAIALDESQSEAAKWGNGPLLVDAGPGTGKTRTLVERVQHLLNSGVSAASILALTFSRKAAEEMRERISIANPDAAIEMWVGTFHAFGQELVTKWPEKCGRTGKVRVLDEAGTLALLEANLHGLPLRHFQNLYEPAFDLVPVQRAISRCKDELIDPETLRRASQQALEAATSDEEREAAEKALEVANIYDIYQTLLQEHDAVDFGDLVMLAAQALEDHPDLAEAHHKLFEHVLVDEYQDVNLASSRLLRALCKPAGDCWVVADQRQSIYRFRGAQPENVKRFPKQFGGDRRSLKFNYRSGAPVVRAFENFASNMRAAPPGSQWTPKRGEIGAASLVESPSLAAEASAIRSNIEQLLTKGIGYSDQVILARSHLTLGRIAGALEELGVPLLYLGDLFEREDIRNLLSLLAIDAEPGGLGLVRTAQLAEYGATKQDALLVIQWAQERDLSVIDALARLTEIENLTEPGRTGLGKLGAQLQGLGQASPWVFLTTWLFERSQYLAPLLRANDTASQQHLIAIYQLLKVCGEQIEFGGLNRKRFLDRIRRIEALNDDKIYRAVSSEASDMDAVRVMTIHGSKGLEFRGVHLPALATRYMPATRQPVRCPMPASLPQLATSAEDHEAEEECLFFVALSRARDYLFLSRADRYTSTNASASKFLPLIGSVPTSKHGEARHPALPPKSGASRPAARDSYDERELSAYMQCPASYNYEFVDGLRGGRDNSAYIRFHRCVYRTIGWLEAEHSAGRRPDVTAALAQLESDWAQRGPVNHGFEPYYRSSATAMVTTMAQVIAAEQAEYERGEWSIPLVGKKVALTPDRIVIKPNGAVHIQRIRTGRRTKSEQGKAIYALLRLGAALRYPGQTAIVETFYPSTGEAVVSPIKNDDKLLDEYRNAISGIEQGEFAAKPDPRRCPNCQSYWICGA
jgi:superfamily I DNA/RNA helicase